MREFCGHCERFGCEANAKASPNVCILPNLFSEPKFELRNYAYVKELVYDDEARKVKAVHTSTRAPARNTNSPQVSSCLARSCSTITS